MGKVEVNWELVEAPVEGEGWPDAARRRRRTRGWTRRLALALLAIGLLALGGWAFTRIGWQRIERQLEREVAYEDEQSRAGLIDVVLAVQARDAEAWRKLRAAEVAAGLPATLPAANLLPADEPAHIVELKLAGANVYAARVRRSYLDAAGQAYELDVWQRYRNVGAGLWERLPPDEAGLSRQSAWAGVRLSAELPAADAPILEPVLEQVDAELQRACLEWACPLSLTVPITFTGQLAALPVVTPTLRPSENSFGPYPAVFDWAVNTERAAEALVLPAPSLAGLPADEAAGQALARSLAARGLLYLAEAQAGPEARVDDLAAQVLAAQAEVRLGLAPPPGEGLRPESYRRPADLWRLPRGTPNRLPELELGYRLQALSFLDFALAGRPSTVYRQLFGALAYNLQPRDWLSVGLGRDLERLTDEWAQAAAREFEQHAVSDWARFEGLAFHCEGAVNLVRGGQVQTVLTGSAGQALDPSVLAPDTQSLLLLRNWTNDHGIDLTLLDLRTAETLTVAAGAVIDVVGWSAAGDLLYVQEAPSAGASSGMYEVWRYLPASGRHERLIAEPVANLYGGVQRWAPDHQALGLTLIYPTGNRAWLQAPAVVSLSPVAQVTRLADEGRDPTFSPDGRFVAYVRQSRQYGKPFDPGSAIVVYDRRDGSQTELVTLSDLALSPKTYLQATQWSPDASRLAFVATMSEGVGSSGLFLIEQQTRRVEVLASLPRDNLAYPVGFSADGRYLAYLEFIAGSGSEARLTVYDLANGRRRQYLAYSSMAWSPFGHELALTNPAGVYAADPETGAYEWISSGCWQVVWYP